MSIVVAACRRLSHAARWNGQAPHTTTGVASVSDAHCQASNWSAGTIASSTTGTVSSAETTSRCCRRASSGSASSSGSATPASAGAGSAAAYPAAETAASRSSGVTGSA